MGTLSKQIIEDIVTTHGLSLKDFPHFIETGTHTGETCLRVQSLFADIHTIECSIKYYEQSRVRLSGHKNIQVYLGDSTDVLPGILKKINENCFFWLDGHYSGGDTAKSKKDCPILEECKAINDFCALTKNKAIILIDDLRLFETNDQHDWNNITVKNILSSFTVNVKDIVDIERDMYRIIVL